MTLEESARQAQAGDAAALEALVKGLQGPMYRLALRMLGLAEPARDATQEILILEIEPAAFRKRLSRARARLEEFLGEHCGVANPANRCRCKYQIGIGLAAGRLDPARLPPAVSRRTTSLEVLQAHDELRQVRESIELYRAQPTPEPPEDFAQRIRSMLDSSSALLV